MRRRRSWRNVNPKKTIQVGGACLTEVVTIGKFQHALKWTIINFHHQKTGFVGAARIGPVATDAEPISFHCYLEILAAHPREFDFDHQTGIGGINVGIRNPVTIGGGFPPADCGCSCYKLRVGTDFGNGHVRGETISGDWGVQAHHLGLTIMRERSPLRA